MPSPPKHIRYLPSKPHLSALEIDLVDIGRQSVSPESNYPPAGHPSAYNFSWEAGRILDEHQLLYLTEGRGFFETRGSQLVELCAGSLVLLRSGDWHRYRPDFSSGWVEYWIGFRGPLADAWITRFIPEKHLVFKMGDSAQTLGCFETALAWMRSDEPGHRQVASSKIFELLALIRAHCLASTRPASLVDNKIVQAQQWLLNRLDQTVAMPDLARQLGLSYSLFRQAFKSETGYAPGTYLRKIRINRAKDLLRTSRASISAIAETTGFNSVYYFSKFFKKETGRSPSQYRQALD